ncbi:hypothetical protein KY290_028153 [Solanum tuberosum]|uniref:DUF7081 domain-containing protein n=1 Tax=Solanum tuberosum TaxID=4113 RepID=A0ABQ7UH22_SOLTU|nr:hypothetical protein KY290_028153 [Solanum tuberosum]
MELYPIKLGTFIGINRVTDYHLNVRQGGVSEYDSGEGLPYAPVDWPNVGDKWGWRTGKRATNSGTFKDRYLYLPECFHAPKDGKKNAFRSKTSVKKYLQSEYLGMDID